MKYLNIRYVSQQGIAIQLFRYHRPCEYCNEMLHTNKPDQKYHKECKRAKHRQYWHDHKDKSL